MQVIFLPKGITILLCFLIWPFFQVLVAVICIKLPDRFFIYSRFFYRDHNWEKGGRFYEKYFFIRRWKKYLPDGGSLIKGGFAKKKLTSFAKENLEKYLLESCRAEMIHWLGILPFWFFGFFTPPQVIIYMFIYAVVVNLPCILAQRYNRPRIVRMINRYKHSLR